MFPFQMLKEFMLSSASIIGFCVLITPFQVSATTFIQENLVSDGSVPAQITDPNLVNAWGISSSPTSPFWVSDNGTGLTTLYNVDPNTDATVKQGLVVTIPGTGTGNPTGQVFNSGASTGAFNGNPFLFVSEDGTVSGWRAALATTAEILQTGSSANVYKGATEATVNGNSYLYAANFRAGTIDVIKGTAAAPNLTGNFTDPNLPAGYAPFNIQNLDGKIYVTYALQDAAKHDDVAGAGKGFVNAFDTQGNLLGRVGSGGSLNSPWGLAIAPKSFGQFAGDLLVGNFGDGHISVFNSLNDAFMGQLLGLDGKELAIDGLWGLTPGNDGRGGSSNKLYFTAGPGNETHGLFGVIEVAVPEPGSLSLIGFGLAAIVFGRRRFVQRS